ncbi:MAG: hypothetical protein ACTINN_07165, partial [Brachybacterium tyrofermentans]
DEGEIGGAGGLDAGGESGGAEAAGAGDRHEDLLESGRGRRVEPTAVRTGTGWLGRLGWC